MRSYGQYCALARSLDLVGDRWTLLIIRELFARDSRYTDLRNGLPGIATNLLADRLRDLQHNGLIEAYDAPPPVRATVYRLTPRGRELGPVLRAMMDWGMPLMKEARAHDEFRPQWLALVLRTLYDGIATEDLEPLTVMVVTEHEPVAIEVGTRSVDILVGTPSSSHDVTLEGDPHDVYSYLAGEADQDPAKVELSGSSGAIERLHTLIERAAATRETDTA